MHFSSLRPGTRAALLILLAGFTALLTTRQYGQNSHIHWAYWLGELGLRALYVVLGLVILVAPIVDRRFAGELRSPADPRGEIAPSERAKWILIGLLVIAAGSYLTVNGLADFLTGCDRAGC